MATTVINDPNFAQTPEQLAESERLKAEGTYPGFTGTLDQNLGAATKELQPYYSTLFDQLGAMEQQAIGKSSQTYEDIVRNLREGYNSRGTFFSGPAISAESRAAAQQVENVGNIVGGFATKRAAAGLEMTNRATERAGQILKQQFDEYQATKAADIQRTVSAKVAEYLPGYAKAVQAQMADENSPWLEIPLEAGVDYGTDQTTAAPATSTAAPVQNTTPAVAGGLTSQFAKNEVSVRNGGIYLTPESFKARALTPAEIKKYKPTEVFRMGKTMYLRKGVKRK